MFTYFDEKLLYTGLRTQTHKGETTFSDEIAQDSP